MNDSVNRLTQAALTAKNLIDRATDTQSLGEAFQALGTFAVVAVETPFPLQEQASEHEGLKIPVMEGLLREIHTATVRLACEAESRRNLAAAS